MCKQEASVSMCELSCTHRVSVLTVVAATVKGLLLLLPYTLLHCTLMWCCWIPHIVCYQHVTAVCLLLCISDYNISYEAAVSIRPFPEAGGQQQQHQAPTATAAGLSALVTSSLIPLHQMHSNRSKQQVCMCQCLCDTSLFASQL